VLAEIDKAVVLPSPNDLNWRRSFGLIYYLVQVWDKRCFITKGQAAGVLMGHLEGITFIDSRGDGRYLISNGKDQTIKLWDIRKMSSNAM
jgi:WD40 repeat protein